jgi:putative spermidine/putrescine transport system permease protein
MIRDTSLASRIWAFAIWAVTGFFVLNLFGVIASVVISSFGSRWLGTWLPAGYTTRWYLWAWDEFQLDQVLVVTLQVVFAVALLSALLGVPAAYALARREFPGKRWLMLLFLLPLLVPPVTYGIPLATVLYRAGLAGTIWGVILVMIPFVEQIDPRVEAAARVHGAGLPQVFLHILLPLLAPGVLAAMVLVFVRTTAMFELTFLTAGPTSQTLVVSLYYAVGAAGIRPVQSIDAMAVIYMAMTLVWLVVALQFVNPNQIVGHSSPQKAA